MLRWANVNPHSLGAIIAILRAYKHEPDLEAGFMREGVERSRVPWVLGGRRDGEDDALSGGLRRCQRIGCMPLPGRPAAGRPLLDDVVELATPGRDQRHHATEPLAHL